MQISPQKNPRGCLFELIIKFYYYLEQKNLHSYAFVDSMSLEGGHQSNKEDVLPFYTLPDHSPSSDPEFQQEV